MVDDEKLLTTQEVADLLRVHPQSVRDWIRKGEIRAIQLGRRSGNRIRKADLDAFMAARAMRPPSGDERGPADTDAQPGSASEQDAYTS